ncbi:2-oxoglutarate dehydrogenase E1 component [candidate division KSB3 bacterium]|uniref:oxoglutarate dehydrogenase (succinyl-transferring) n=1 Tax=candidate division KSB3 bacterium TaxID=2044937 RepID=A0A2G6KBT9_9BACT|nr:MAG: 2-oxoglutarate dehydrogenase E1 component [candidate division KSB3 bacterium]
MSSFTPHNSSYLEDVYQEWQNDPHTVSPEWDAFFRQQLQPQEGPLPSTETEQIAYKQSRVNSLIWAYRDIGYAFANLNPLGDYTTPELEYMYLTMKGIYQNLELNNFGLESGDLERVFFYKSAKEQRSGTLRDIVGKMRDIYCSTIGYEFLHIQNKVMRNWLIRRIEEERTTWPVHEKIRFQKDLIKAENFEHFIQSNFIGQKRFSLEGGEVLVPVLHYVFRASIGQNLQGIVIGMAHRGRLNIFTNAMRKPASDIFGMFLHNYHPHMYGGTGDVKYHLGQSFDFRHKESGTAVHISLVPNPSHLESVNPVVEGKTRAIQRKRRDRNRKKILPILIHGDSAFSGQGIVAETFNLSQLKGYQTGGTIHIVLNNQIGFTTASRESRSTFFATDIAKTMPVPIFHVNGDDPEAAVQAIQLALAWRQKFGYDVVVDIICYRRLGHNEADEPSFTHPRMYSLIKNHPSVSTLYGEKLDAEKTFSAQEQKQFQNQYLSVLKAELEHSRSGAEITANDGFQRGDWKQFQTEYSFEIPDTSISEAELVRIGKVLTDSPDNFSLHPKLKRILNNRKQVLENGEGFDWGFAESLSFGSLLLEGHHVRLSGEDCGRGTFSHRHALWWDAEAQEPRSYAPLNDLAETQGRFSVYDSPLSEFSVLGFEYGYSTTSPDILVIWEGQFGDFVNGAQVIIDQYIVSGEAKWFRASGLVMLLPHGVEGQGPEHSHAYLERFLQLCAQQNIQVCNLTTPAQYFHVLRKQMKQPFRKPLIIMSPKSLLRHKLALSSKADFTEGRFEMILDDPKAGNDATRGILCSGKVYYDLLARRDEQQRTDTAIVRIEQLYPFPKERLQQTIEAYPAITEWAWVQEETQNRGAWSFIHEQYSEHLSCTVSYIGRPASASPATGSYTKHVNELEDILHNAFH